MKKDWFEIFGEECGCFKRFIICKLKDFEQKIIGMVRSVETWNEVDDPQGTLHWPDGDGNIKIWIPRRYPPNQIISSDKLFEVHVDEKFTGTVNGLVEFVEKTEGQVEQLEYKNEEQDVEINNIKAKNQEQDDTDTYIQSQINVVNQNIVNLSNTKLNKYWPNAPAGYVATLDANHNFVPMEPTGGGGDGDWDEARIEAIENNVNTIKTSGSRISFDIVYDQTLMVELPFLMEKFSANCLFITVASSATNVSSVTIQTSQVSTRVKIMGTIEMFAGTSNIITSIGKWSGSSNAAGTTMSSGNIGANTGAYKECIIDVILTPNPENNVTGGIRLFGNIRFRPSETPRCNLISVYVDGCKGLYTP